MKQAVCGRCVLCLGSFMFLCHHFNKVAAAMGNSGYITNGNQCHCWPAPSGKAGNTRTRTKSSAQDLFDLSISLSSAGMAAVRRGKLGKKSV